MQRLLRQYRNDVGDMLAEADVHLLELEVAGERAEPDLLGRLSRLVHGLRGAAGLLGLNGAGGLARVLEAGFELARDGTLPLTPEAVSVLNGGMKALAAVSGVSDAADDATTRDAAASAKEPDDARYAALCVPGEADDRAALAGRKLTDQLEAALPPDYGPRAYEVLPVTAPGGGLLFDLHGIDVLRAERDGLYLYVVEFGGSDDLLRKDLSPLGLLAFLRKSGLVLDARFVPAGGGQESVPEGGLLVLYASILQPDLVNTVFQVTTDRVHPIDVEAVRRGEPGWRNVPQAREAKGELHVAAAPDKDSIDALVRQYDTAMRMLREESMDNESDDERRFSGTVVDPDAEERRLAELEAEFAAGMDALGTDDDAATDGASQHVLATLLGDMLSAGPQPGMASAAAAAVTPGMGSDMEPGMGPDMAGVADPDADLFADADDGPAGETVAEHAVAPAAAEGRPEAASSLGTAPVFVGQPHVESPPVSMADTGSHIDFSDAGAFGSEEVDIPAPAHPASDANLALHEAAPAHDEDPDADLFADSGEAPDLSYLDAALAERSASGVALDLSAASPSRKVGGFAVRDAEAAGGGVLVLTGELTIGRGADLREALLDVLGSFTSVRIDMGGVTDADLTLVQLLQSAAVTARAQGVDLATTGSVAEPVLAAARRTGLDAAGVRRVGLERLLPPESL